MEEEKLDWEDFKESFGSWQRFMKPVVESKEMYDVFQYLKKSKLEDRENIFPYSDDTFKAFKLCDAHFLKLIVISMEPYSGLNKDKTPQATGICLDCSNNKDGILQPSLVKFLEGIAKDLDEPVEKTNDITYIPKQGVLMLNRSFTVFHRKIGSNIGKWDFFYKYFFEEVINPYFTGIPILLLGKDAAFLKRYIFEMSNPVFVIDHPSFAARSNSDWNTKGMFTRINKMLYDNNKMKIYWDKRAYEDLMNDLPF